MYHIANAYGSFPGRNLEWDGETIARMQMQGGLTLATLSAELSCDFSLFEYNDVTASYLQERASKPFEPVDPDPDASYEQSIHINLTDLEPLMVIRDKFAHNTRQARELTGTRIDQAFIGSCAIGRIEDLAIAAEIMRGK